MKGWQPLQEAEAGPITEQLIRDVQASNPVLSRQGVIDLLEQEAARTSYWLNDLYQVAVTLEEPFVHINIRRRDGSPIFRDWRHFQQIKNELVGPECEAVELYPAESRLVDTSNKYHLYAVPDPSFRFDFGYQQRDVSTAPGSTNGTRQRA